MAVVCGERSFVWLPLLLPARMRCYFKATDFELILESEMLLIED